MEGIANRCLEAVWERQLLLEPVYPQIAYDALAVYTFNTFSGAKIKIFSLRTLFELSSNSPFKQRFNETLNNKVSLFDFFFNSGFDWRVGKVGRIREVRRIVCRVAKGQFRHCSRDDFHEFGLKSSGCFQRLSDGSIRSHNKPHALSRTLLYSTSQTDFDPEFHIANAV